ncbi:hypothetical protein VTH06DRAFT_3494 [Thermothelomyces fergusii]
MNTPLVLPTRLPTPPILQSPLSCQVNVTHQEYITSPSDFLQPHPGRHIPLSACRNLTPLYLSQDESRQNTIEYSA